LNILGEGHFSRVYNATYRGSKAVAVKILDEEGAVMAGTEVELLRALRGVPHVIQLLEVMIEPELLLIFELVKPSDPEDLFRRMTPNDLKTVLRCILEALKVAHSRGIVHRDVKLGNILIAENRQEALLADWGCGAWVSDSMSTKAGSRSCRPPEMLFGVRNYGTSCDIWAFGVLILYFLSDGWVPWKARTTARTIGRMSQYFGGNLLEDLCARLGGRFPNMTGERLVEDPILTLETIFSDTVFVLWDPNLIDLMKVCLSLEPKDRPTAESALNHPYFVPQD
jgi:serine/threonine protein kinase